MNRRQGIKRMRVPAWWIAILCLVIVGNLFGQVEKKDLQAARDTSEIVISDVLLSDADWCIIKISPDGDSGHAHLNGAVIDSSTGTLVRTGTNSLDVVYSGNWDILHSLSRIRQEQLQGRFGWQMPELEWSNSISWECYDVYKHGGLVLAKFDAALLDNPFPFREFRLTDPAATAELLELNQQWRTITQRETTSQHTIGDLQKALPGNLFMRLDSLRAYLQSDAIDIKEVRQRIGQANGVELQTFIALIASATRIPAKDRTDLILKLASTASIEARGQILAGLVAGDYGRVQCLKELASHPQGALLLDDRVIAALPKDLHKAIRSVCE